MDLDQLNTIIVRAKAATYVGGGMPGPSSRLGAHDIAWAEGDWHYLDSYFGGSDFIGQEVLWHAGNPVWSMSYYGYIRRPELIDGERAGATIKAALAALYAEGRFLGSFDWTGPHGQYRDSNEGTVAQFRGRESIRVGGVEAYALDYFGGLIRP